MKKEQKIKKIVTKPITKSLKSAVAKVEPIKPKSKSKVKKSENSITIVDNKNRGVLFEGRNNGMGFAFLKKIEDDKFETVQPYSPCKDYLAEVVTTEKYNVGTQGCGLKYRKKLDIFVDYAYLGIKIQKTKNNSYNYSSSYENDVNKLNNNYKNLELFINNIEKDLNLKTLTEIIKVKDNDFIVKFDLDWVQSTHSISLYTLLLRVGMFYESGSYMSFLEGFNYNIGDVNLLKQAIPKFKSCLEKKKLPPNRIGFTIDSLKNGSSPHDYGILFWDGSFEEKIIS